MKTKELTPLQFEALLHALAERTDYIRIEFDRESLRECKEFKLHLLDGTIETYRLQREVN